MKPLQEALENNQKLTIQTLVKHLNEALSELWDEVWHDNEEELTRMFAEYGDRAYGAYVQKLVTPLCEQIRGAGYGMKSGFHYADSIENWGPPEERERCAWYVIERPESGPLGTAVLQLYHSHARFRLPQAPAFFALEETEREAIVTAITYAAVRTNRYASGGYQDRSADSLQQWEYATDTGLGDYIRSSQAQRAAGLDPALAPWGRNGWELVSVVPHNDRLIGFFKRPAAHPPFAAEQ
ncbi:hypothetical protein DVH26_00540 [Paenibacillus sp. H1-7]|uniref:DUF6022 family protein n=1 Tax=Paenibacillus sp. H1-7 TaxID=2282849 RepID=UPI001EF98721|nr:DUF6022 family protein [Paenibacillus sp. H1-7]ULL13096.1 hypothetical protein DVH26_00540 [Paenibacillus sp. H1-7]